jgi:BASS family bile acid:Na+ symporter
MTIVRTVSRYSVYLFLISGLIALGMLFLGNWAQAGPLVIVALASLALYCMGNPFFRSFAFTVWVFVFVAASIFYPWAFGTWLGFDLKHLIVPLIQIIMFGMGTTLSVGDFGRVFKMPWPVFVGILSQFTIMPLTGYTIAALFGFSPEVAAGVILIGSCPGGVASNLMTFLARGDVALSVTMTSSSTLMSPLMTPLMMKVLAGRLVPIDFLAMMFSILNMIIVPILAGLVANRILYSRSSWANEMRPLALVSVVGIVLAIVTGLLRAGSLGPLAALKNGVVIGLALMGTVALTKLIVAVVLKREGNWMDRVLPLVSMSGICFIIAIITARSRAELLSVGVALITAVVIHNFVGYVLGYWFAKAVRLDEKTCRTVAFEVGMQNGGMASGLAMGVLKSANAALAPAIFGPWMNVSGSVLATWWHRKPVAEHDGTRGMSQ